MSPVPSTLRVVEDGPVARVTFDHAPINLFDPAMIEDLRALVTRLAARPDLGVVVFDSADPDFFVGHADLNLFLDPVESVPPKPTRLTALQQLFEDLRALPQATIAVVAGRTSGAGPEIVTSCDMAFAVRGAAVFSHLEVALGLLPGATGTQRLPKLLGRSRALEVILGCDEFDADLAASYGLVNRALDAAEAGPFVARLVGRLATFAPAAIAQAKSAVAAAELPTPLGLLEEAHAANHLLVGGEAQRRMRRFLDLGGQRPEFERHGLAEALTRLAE